MAEIQDLLLIGGGHSHALLLATLAKRPLPDTRVTLLSDHWRSAYSGMLPGYLAGHYRDEEIFVDLPSLCQRAGVRFVRDRLVSLSATERVARLADSGELAFDWVSVNTGSTPRVGVNAPEALGIKPVAPMLEQWQQLIDSQTQALRVSVVGAGAGGVEVALALRYRWGERVAVNLVCSGARVLPEHSEHSARSAERACKRWGVTVHYHCRIEREEAGVLVGQTGQRLPSDISLWCTGAQGPDFETDLLRSERGFLQVNRALQSLSHPQAFVAGDAADIEGVLRPKAGVFAVRQAPILERSLRAALAGATPPPGRLQQRYLSLLALGEQRATGGRGPLQVTGEWVWRWKDRIDRAFMQRLAPMPMPAGEMLCGGCASKLGPDLLGSGLRELLPQAQVEDAAIVEIHGQTLVQSLDGFRAFTDDLYRFGQISVYHALSDLYAMGATPTSAQVWVNLAQSHPRLQQRDWRRLMHGVRDALHAHDCALLGGHSSQGAECHLGIVANGQLANEQSEKNAHDRLWSKRGAQPGDLLVLTKPLGTGVVLAAAAQGHGAAKALAAAYRSMLHSNAQTVARLRALALQPSAVTDVTGFGLIGHLLEMLDGQLGADISLSAVPILDGARALADAGVRSSLFPSLQHYWAHCSLESRDQVGADFLLDPQTSGGLLIAIPAAQGPLLDSDPSREWDRELEGELGSVIGTVTTGSVLRIGD